MSQAKVSPSEFIDYLIASPRQGTATEAARTQPDSDDPAAHDAYTRLLYRISLIRNHPSATAQWNPTAPLTVAG